jgi:hypothetical protein
MQKRNWKRIALGVFSVFLFLVVVLAVHIYIVTRPKAPDANTRIMARIDVRQPLTAADASKITAWLYRQKGIDHVLVNPATSIVVFTFFPIKTSAGEIVGHFKSDLPYKGDRFMPGEEAMTSGCPVAATSLTYKVYSFLKHTF